MTESLSVSVKSRSSGKIYLLGTACGNSGKKYCLNCYVYSNKLSGYVGNAWHSYTYFSGGKCIDIGSQGCYIPDYGDGLYRIYLDEVTEYGCDYIIRTAVAKTIDVSSEPETVIIDVYVKDQHGTGVDDAKVTIPTASGTKTITTNFFGLAVGFTLEKGKTHTASVTYLPSEWETTSGSTISFGANQSGNITLTVNKKLLTCCIDFLVMSMAWKPINGVRCSIGGKSATTDDIGTCSITVECGKSYTATCDIPSGYTCECSGCVCSDGPFTPTGSGLVTFYLKEVSNGVECAGKTNAECDATPGCYWWTSDNACHDTAEPTDYPTLTITSDIDNISGIDAYVDGTRRGVTPITISFDESEIDKTVSVTGLFAGILMTKDKSIALGAGSNKVELELMMDNKEIIAGGAIATVALLSFV